ncbi:MAG: molybdate ABC transporter substrate-binding protein [Alphaproteobacteria bacterium]|nr:molybdate ABC transporter substrate-binding protein [Alphaproteobacteria bacterium]
MRLSRLLAALAISLLLPLGARAGAAPITVFAAASLTNALQAAGAIYQKQTGTKLAFSFAASSVLAKQIDASRGADLYISADEKWMDFLQKNGRIVDSSRKDLLGNALVLIAPKASTASIIIAPHFALVRALDGGRLAVADTGTVPAGRYARAALTSLGVWDAVSGDLATAENVRVALAYVARGEAPLGIVYRTDALIEPAVKIVGTFPAGSHPPIVYPAALVKGAQPGTEAFLKFLSSDEARAVFRKSGFDVLP